MRQTKYTWSWPLLVPLCLALCACDRGAPASDAAAKRAQETNATETTTQDGPPIELPYIHIEQTEEFRQHGVVVVEGNYRWAWSNCQKIPRVAKRPLPDDVIGKLGRTYYQVWYAGKRLAVRTDEWKFSIDGDSLCEFSPAHEAKLTIVTPEGAELIDLIRHTRAFNDNIRLRLSTANEIATAKSREDPALEAKVRALLIQQGHADMLGQKMGNDVLAGQPCLRGRGRLTEDCVWTGGARWGFQGGEASLLSWIDLRVNLQSMPVDHGDGTYLTTQRMTVGQPFDAHVFDPPSGLTDAR